MTSEPSADDRQAVLDAAVDLLRPNCRETARKDVENAARLVEMARYAELDGSPKEVRKQLNALSKHLARARDELEALSGSGMAVAALRAAESTDHDRASVAEFVSATTTTAAGHLGTPEFDAMIRGLPYSYSDTLPMLLGLLAERCSIAHELVPFPHGGGSHDKRGDARKRIAAYWALSVFEKHRPGQASLGAGGGDNDFRGFVSLFYEYCDGQADSELDRAVCWALGTRKAARST